MLKDLFFPLSLHCILLSVNSVLCSSVAPCFKTHIGGVPGWNNEIRGISFIIDTAILFQSSFFTRAAKGPEIQADQSSYQLTPHPLPLFLLLSLYFTTVSHRHYYLCFALSFLSSLLFILSYSTVQLYLFSSSTFTFNLLFLPLYSYSPWGSNHPLYIKPQAHTSPNCTLPPSFISHLCTVFDS